MNRKKEMSFWISHQVQLNYKKIIRNNKEVQQPKNHPIILNQNDINKARNEQKNVNSIISNNSLNKNISNKNISNSKNSFKNSLVSKNINGKVEPLIYRNGKK